VEHTGARPSDFSPELITEQQNGVFAWDVMESTGTSNMHEVLLGADAFQDFMPFIVNQDLVDDSKWGTGFKMFSSASKPHIFLHEISISNDLYINRDVISKDELKTLDDLLDPKWQGKIVVDDCTVAAQGASTLLGVWQARGGDFVRKLLTTQKPVFQETVRITTEWAATGRYPIGIGVSQPELRRLQNDGIGNTLEQLDYGGGNPAAAGVAAFKNAPHPNAARVFINWFLSQQGQQAWVEAWNAPIPRNSRRLDVPVKNPASYPDYGKLGSMAIWGTESGTDLIKQLTTLCKEVRP
jgi:iron(III) transport system substrate-binding protein